MIHTLEKVVEALQELGMGVRDSVMEHDLMDQTTRRAIIGLMGVVLVLYTVKVWGSEGMSDKANKRVELKKEKKGL